MKSIGVGLVGFGFGGEKFHAPVIRSVPGLHLAAILSRGGSRAQQAYPDVPVVRSMEELLARSDVQLVAISTPNTSHYSLARQAIEAGRDVVVDKPFAPTKNEAADLVELARVRNRLLSVYHDRRWDGDFFTLQKLVQQGTLGRLVLFESHFDRCRPRLRPGAWREQPGPGNGVFFDLGPHLIDQVLVLFGRPQSITADIRIEREGALVDDAFDVVMHYSGGLRALLVGDMLAAAPSFRFLLRGTEGSYLKFGMDPQEEALKRGQVPADDPHWGIEPQANWGKFYICEEGGISVRPVPTETGDYRGYYENIRDAIRGEAELAVTPEHALDVMHVLELAVESSRQRRTLDWVAV